MAIKIVIDLDGTLTIDDKKTSYDQKKVDIDLVDQLKKFKETGCEICIYTSRNMKSLGGNIGLLNVQTLPKILKWLDENNVPYDEVVLGKPWCGEDGFYVDNRAIRPSEFKNLTFRQIQDLLE